MAYLNAFDRQMISNEIHQILQCFGTEITIINPSPLASQTNYDDMLDEFHGAIVYTQHKIPAMRYDGGTEYTEIYELDSKKYGDMRECLLSYKISRKDCTDNGIVLNSHTDFAIDSTGDIYYLEKVEKKIGEYRIFIRRYPDGRKPQYANLVTPSADW